MASSVKIGADVTQFKQGLKEAQASVKTLDQELKRNEAQLKASGDKEKYMADKGKLLEDKLKAQKTAANNLEKAMKTMADNGVKTSSVEYQKLEQQLAAVQTEMINTEMAAEQLKAGEEEAARGANDLSNSLDGISKKMSLDQVIGGINSITGALETAAGKAINLGQVIWNNVMESAQWADDTATMALMYGVDLDTYLRVQKLVENGMDTSVEAILKSQSKLKKNIGTGSDAFMQTMKELGLMDRMVNIYGEHIETLATYDPDEMFWRAGQAIMALTDEYEQEAKAQEVFGKSWRELIPLFSQYKSLEEYQEALKGVNVNSEEDVNALAELNDKVAELKANFTTLSNEVWASMAPALTAAAEALNGLLTSVLEYLDTPEGQKALDHMEKAVSGLFEDLGSIDPDQVVEGFVAVFDKVVGGLQWLDEHKEALGEALKWIVGAWATVKITGGALEILKLVDGLRGLTGLGAAQGAIAGASWGGAFAEAAMSAITYGLPFLLFADGLIHDQKTIAEMNEKGQASLESTALKKEQFAGDALYEVWDALNDYLTISGDSASDKAKMDAFADRYMRWLNDEITDSTLDSFADLMTQDEWEAFNQSIRDYVNGTAHYSDEEIGAYYGPMQKALELLEADLEKEPASLTFEPEVPEDTAEQISEQVGTVPVYGQLVMEDFEWPEDANSHANGLWSVPWDGYPAILHKGERVVPARQVNSRNFSSNLYIESMYMNNGTDANGLAAAMAAAQKRTMAGFGS